MSVQNLKKWREKEETSKETGVIRCEICRHPVSVEECDTRMEMVEKLVDVHVSEVHYDGDRPSDAELRRWWNSHND